MKKRLLIELVTGLFLAGMVGVASADLISSSEYNLTSIVGSYAWGMTDWNDAYGSGYVDNVSDLHQVETLLSDGYMYSQPSTGPINGIYNWLPSGTHSLTFEFSGGSDYSLDSLSFISSRNYGNTPILVDYQLDSGAWMNAVTTSSSALGIGTGSGMTYTLDLGGVIADSFRFSTIGGSQVSLHEISISGTSAAPVPEPATMLLFGTGLVGLVGMRRRKSKK